MKMIVAFLQTHRLDRVTRRLMQIKGLLGITVVEGRGFGRKNLEDAQNTREELPEFTPNVRIETVVPSWLVESVIEALIEGAHTGERGDGNIFVLPVDRSVRINPRKPGEMAV